MVTLVESQLIGPHELTFTIFSVNRPTIQPPCPATLPGVIAAHRADLQAFVAADQGFVFLFGLEL
ncbi:hypothetical protein EJB05_35887, partial [Eragrostis curvula]